MENRHQKWINLVYLAAAAALSYICYSGLLKLTSLYDLEARIKQIAIISQLGSLGLGAVLFLVLFLNKSANTFTNEVASELERVTWPTQKETASATTIVIVMVLISGVVLGVLDYFWGYLLKAIL